MLKMSCDVATTSALSLAPLAYLYAHTNTHTHTMFDGVPRTHAKSQYSHAKLVSLHPAQMWVRLPCVHMCLSVHCLQGTNNSPGVQEGCVHDVLLPG